MEEVNEAQDIKEQKNLFGFDFKEGNIIAGLSFDKEGYGSVRLQVKIPLIKILEMAVKKTDNKIDDKLVAMVKAALEK